MACEAEKENLAAALACMPAAVAAVKFTPGWWKIATASGILACLLWADSARRSLAECQRREGKTAEADALDQWGDQLVAEIDYLRSLGVPEQAVA
jgi:hypothetical protein